MSQPIGGFTIGVEEEFQIIHPETRHLHSRAGRLLRRAKAEVGDEVTNELYLSQIEIGTPVCSSLAEARAELVRLRKAVVDAAGPTAAGSARRARIRSRDWQDQDLTPKDRYAASATTSSSSPASRSSSAATSTWASPTARRRSA